MTELDPEREEDEPAALRSVAVEALKVRLVKATPRSPIGSPAMALRLSSELAPSAIAGEAASRKPMGLPYGTSPTCKKTRDPVIHLHWRPNSLPRSGGSVGGGMDPESVPARGN